MAKGKRSLQQTPILPKGADSRIVCPSVRMTLYRHQVLLPGEHWWHVCTLSHPLIPWAHPSLCLKLSPKELKV